MGLFVVKDRNKIFKDIIYIQNGNNKFEYKNTSLSPIDIVRVLMTSHPELSGDIYNSYNTWTKQGNASSQVISTYKIDSIFDEKTVAYGAAKVTPENAYNVWYEKYKGIIDGELSNNKLSTVYLKEFEQPYSGIRYYAASSLQNAKNELKLTSEELNELKTQENPDRSDLQFAQEDYDDAVKSEQIAQRQYQAMIDLKKWLKEQVDAEEPEDEEDEETEEEEDKTQEEINEDYKNQEETTPEQQKVETPTKSEDTKSGGKSDSDAKNDGEVEFVEPINEYDPVVVDNLDPNVKLSFIVKGYYESKESDGDGYSGDIQETQVEGISTPLIKYNNIVLDWNDVKYMKITYTSFTPTLDLVLYDNDSRIKFSETPGITNEIDVMLLFPVDEIYKKIALKFYIKEYNVDDNGSISVSCEYKNINIYKKITKQVGSGELSFYECLKTIAKDYELGFAASKKCEDVTDKHIRLIRNQSVQEYIEQQLLSSGVDKDSVFDCFIDVYNYINLINLSAVMKEPIDIKSLGIYSLTGINTVNGDKTTEQTSHYVYRLLTNAQGMTNENNLMIDEYVDITDNKSLRDNGTLVNYYYVRPFGVGDGLNGIEQNEIQIKEDSVDGAHTDEYEYRNDKFMGFEMSETPVLYQTAINKSYKLKLNARQLKVKLHQPNLGLMRGQLVGIYLETSELGERQTIINNASNTLTQSANINDKEIGDDDTTKEFINDVKNDMNVPVMDLSRTDIYYINGIEWVYEEYDEIVEYLYLIKKGRTSNYSNRHTLENINTTDIDTSSADLKETANEAHETDNKITALDSVNEDNNPDGEGGSTGGSAVSSQDTNGDNNGGSESEQQVFDKNEDTESKMNQSENNETINEVENDQQENEDKPITPVNSSNSDIIKDYNSTGSSTTDNMVEQYNKNTADQLSKINPTTVEAAKAEIYNLQKMVDKINEVLPGLIEKRQYYASVIGTKDDKPVDRLNTVVKVESYQNKLKQYQQKISDLQTSINNA